MTIQIRMEHLIRTLRLTIMELVVGLQFLYLSTAHWVQ